MVVMLWRWKTTYYSKQRAEEMGMKEEEINWHVPDSPRQSEGSPSWICAYPPLDDISWSHRRNHWRWIQPQTAAPRWTSVDASEAGRCARRHDCSPALAMETIELRSSSSSIVFVFVLLFLEKLLMAVRTTTTSLPLRLPRHPPRL